jgi:hypothetical protein
MKGHKRNICFLSDLQLLKVWKLVCDNGGTMAVEDIIHNEVTIGRWFTPVELISAINRHLDDTVKSAAGGRPSIVVSEGIVYNNVATKCWLEKFEAVLKRRVELYAPFIRDQVKGRYGMEEEE